MAEGRGFIYGFKTVFDYIGRFFKGIYYLMAINWMTILSFEAIYKLVAYFLCRPLLTGIMRLAYRAAGASFVSNMNIGKFFASPTSWVCIIVMVFIVSLYMLFDICCIVVCYHASYHKQKIPLLFMMKEGIIAAKEMLRPRNYRMILYLLLIIPMSQLISLSGFVEGFSIPDFVMSFIQNRTWLFVIFVIASIYVEFVCLQWIFSFHNFTLRKERFVDASHRSWRMIKGVKKFPVYVLSIVGWELLVLFAFFLLTSIGGALIVLLSHIPFAAVVVDSAFAVLLDIVYAFMFCMTTPLVFLGLSQIYYMGMEHSGQKDDIPGRFKMQGAIRLVDTKIARRIYRKRALIIILGISTVLAVNIIIALYRESDYYKSRYTYEIKVAAHRGDEISYPENTIPAFAAAIDQGADMIELDVHLSKDGQLIVMHDESLKRTTGLDKYIYEMNAEDILRLDAGSWFSSEFSDVRVPLLSEVMDLALESDVLLNIELKPNDNVDGLAEAVIDMIHEYGLEERCLVASLNYEELEDAKAYDSTISTMYITHILLGDMTEMEAADGYSVESTSVTASFIRAMHKKGKYVYVWTVNSEDDLEYITRMNPDGIVTNYTELAKQIAEDRDEESYWQKYIDKLDTLF